MDTHGHYGSNKRDRITIRHRYKGSHDKVENIRAFGNMKITTLKNLIAFLDTAITKYVKIMRIL